MEKFQVSTPFSGAGKYELNNGLIVNLGKYNRRCLRSDKIKCEGGFTSSWQWETNGTIRGLGFSDHSPLYLKRKLNDVENVVNNKPSLISRMSTYFVVGPAKGIYRVAKESMGYIVFLGLLSVAGYSCYNPSGVATFVKSCVPNISVSVEKPEILK